MSWPYYDRHGRPIDGRMWGQLFARQEYKRVLWTRLRGGKRVSTVWLGLNHNFHDDGPPLIFETMVFGHDGDSLVMQRYKTEAMARLGHWLLVREWSYNRRQRRRWWSGAAWNLRRGGRRRGLPLRC